ncbi:hypothetical protein [Peribacillus loiseleuriae]|uniref:hypothetical protein n=1 Tax=Peribacillus loiseleuriae TaxID=1679170 RepID=UPI003D02E06E
MKNKENVAIIMKQALKRQLGEKQMSELKKITMIFNGKPSEEAFENFVRIINEAAKNNRIREIIKKQKDDKE